MCVMFFRQWSEMRPVCCPSFLRRPFSWVQQWKKKKYCCQYKAQAYQSCPHVTESHFISGRRSAVFFTGLRRWALWVLQPPCSRASSATPLVDLAPVTVILAYSGFYGSRKASLLFSELWALSGVLETALPTEECSNPSCG
ncbi:hypothetical protein XENORESO_018304, partial [Xenotaenia resolanae]